MLKCGDAGRQGIDVAIEVDGDAIVGEPFHAGLRDAGSAPECQDHGVPRLHPMHPRRKRFTFDGAKDLLSLRLEDLRDALARQILNVIVEIVIIPAEAIRQHPTDRALSATHEADQIDRGGPHQLEDHRFNSSGSSAIRRTTTFRSM